MCLWWNGLDRRRPVLDHGHLFVLPTEGDIIIIVSLAFSAVKDHPKREEPLRIDRRFDPVVHREKD